MTLRTLTYRLALLFLPLASILAWFPKASLDVYLRISLDKRPAFKMAHIYGLALAGLILGGGPLVALFIVYEQVPGGFHVPGFVTPMPYALAIYIFSMSGYVGLPMVILMLASAVTAVARDVRQSQTTTQSLVALFILPLGWLLSLPARWAGDFYMTIVLKASSQWKPGLWWRAATTTYGFAGLAVGLAWAFLLPPGEADAGSLLAIPGPGYPLALVAAARVAVILVYIPIIITATLTIATPMIRHVHRALTAEPNGCGDRR